MAENTEIAFSATVDTGDGAKSLKALKQEFKDTQKELDGLTVGSEKYIQTLQKLGKIKDDISDLNDEIAAFKPEGKVKAFGNVISGVASGFQAATGAAALFGGENKELEKTLLKVQSAMAFTEGIKGLVSLGDGFKVLGNVIKSNPIFLIASIVLGIGAALYALKDKIGIIGDAFDWLGEIIGSIVQGFKDVTDAMGLTSFKSDALADVVINNAKSMQKAIGEYYDFEIAKANAAGENTFDLERKKQEAIIKTLRIEGEAIVAAAKARGEFTDEERSRFTELIELTKKASQEITLISIKEAKERSDLEEQVTKKKSEEQKKQRDDYNKHIDELRKRNNEAYQQYLEDLQKQSELEIQQKQKQDDEDMMRAFELNQKRKEENDKLVQLRSEQDIKAHDATEKAKYDITVAVNKSMQDTADLYFAIKMANVKKGSAEELKAAKQQFKINKALSIQSTIIAGIQGVVNALSAFSVVPEPYGTILKVANAVAVGVATAANVAKISATQFNESGAGGGSSSVAGVSAPSGNTSAPTLNAPSTSTTQLNPDGTVRNNNNSPQQPIHAYVVEQDVTATQNRINVLQNAAIH